MNIAEICLKKQTVTWALALALTAGGIWSYFRLGRLEDPEFTIRGAQILTVYPGATALEVAERVTDPIETAVQQLGKVKHVTSTSYPGRSIVLVEIQDRYSEKDLPQIWDELRRKVADARRLLPEGCAEPVVNDDYGDVYGMLYAVYGDGYAYADLKKYAKDLRRELLLCEDVGKIDLLGEQTEIVAFEISRAKMANFDITPGMVADAVRGVNVPVDAGRVRAGDKHVRIVPEGAIRSIGDFGEIFMDVPGSDGTLTPVPLKDIFTVRPDYLDPPEVVVRYNGKPSIALGISTAKGGNVIRMGAAVERRLKELLPETPVGIELGVISHQARSVETAVSGFVANLLESVLIVVAVLLVTMGLRSGVLIGLTLFLTVCATIFVMDRMGILFERISLGAFIIALGMLVDNAIVVTEAVLVAAEKGLDKAKAAAAIVRQAQGPLLGATLVAVLSFAPIGASQDATGEYCRSLFLVIAISLLLSWIFALTLTPLLAVKFLKGKEAATGAAGAAPAPDPYRGVFFRVYRGFLEACINHPRFTWFILLGLVAMSFCGMGRVRQNFFPDATRNQFMVHVWMDEGTHIRATEQRVEVVARHVRALPGVTGVTSVTGGGALRFLLSYTPEDRDAAYGVIFADVDDWRRIPALMAQIEAAAPGLTPDARVSCQRFVLGPGDPHRIQMRLVGPDPAVLRQWGERAEAILRADGRLKEIQTDWRNRAEVISPVIAAHRARKMGLNRVDVARGIRNVLEGVTFATWMKGDEPVPLVLRAPAAERDGVDRMKFSWTWSPAPGKPSVPIAQIVERLENTSEEMRVRRRDRALCLTVKCNPAGDETAQQAFARVRPNLEKLAAALPAGYRAEWGGEYENARDANRELSLRMLPVLALMVMIVIMLFNSVRQTLVIFMTVPLILVGIVAGLLAFDRPFGFMAFLGMLSLVGMQIKNAIVLLDEINAQKAAGRELYAAVVNAGVTRLRPVANAALTTVLGMLPLVADAFYSAMAVTIMFGLAFATLLTMVVVPVNYALLYRVRRPAGR